MTNRDLYYPAFSIVFGLICLAVYSWYIQPWMFDDAFIYFRYAENLVNGHGLVYNIGERVEGYTSVLWVLLMAAGEKIGINIIFFSKIIGIIFSSGILFLTAFSFKFIDSITPKTAAIATLFLGTTGFFLPWGVSGIEVMMFAFLLLLTTLYYISKRDNGSFRDYVIVGLFCGLTTLARPEGILLVGLIFFDIFLINKKNRKSYSVIIATIFFIMICIHLALRYHYYGYILPNSYYAKVGFSLSQLDRGIDYLVIFGVPGLMIALPLVDPLKIRQIILKRGGLLFLLMLTALYTLSIIVVGGDYMPAGRFLAPFIAVICILSAYFIQSIPNNKALTLVVVATIAYNIYMLNFFCITPQIFAEPVAEEGREAGLWLKEHANPDAIIATNTAGSIPYYSGLKTIDMLGLNDSHIAHMSMDDMGSKYAGHEKADGRYVLAQRPDYIQFCSSLGLKRPIFTSDKQLYALPEFHELYEYKEHTLPSGKILCLYELRKPTEDSTP